MNDNLQPLPDEHLEARITAYVLGEASPFEAAELEQLIAQSPELKLFLNRTRAIHILITDVETTANRPNGDWKLSAAKRAKLEHILGSTPDADNGKESRIGRVAFRAAMGIAAVLLLTVFTAPMVIRQRKKAERTVSFGYEELVASASMEKSPRFESDGDDGGQQPADPSEPGAVDGIVVGGQVMQPGSVGFKENMTLREAVNRAGGATELGSTKRVKVLRDGEQRIYDISKDEFANVELKSGDVIEMPQKNWFGCGASRDEVIKDQLAQTESEPQAPSSPTAEAPMDALVSNGLRSGDAAITGNSVDAVLNNPNRTTIRQREMAEGAAHVGSYPGVDAFAPAPSMEPAARPLSGNLAGKPVEGVDQDKPVRTNPALTHEHPRKVDEVRRNLYKAQGNYDLGKFDDSKKAYQETLRIDPYNSAARRGMEKIAAAKSDYHRAAYDQTRAELLMQVDKAWELPVPSDLAADENKKMRHFAVDAFAEQGEIAAADAPDDFAGFIDYGSKIDPTSESDSRYHMRLGGEQQREDNAEAAIDGNPLRRELLKSADGDSGHGFGNAAAPSAPIVESDPFFDTSEAVAKADGSKGNTEYEIHAGYASQYLFRGVDLSKEKESQPHVNLADLSQEIPATQEPFSTFSLNISDASFQLARAAVQKGERPDPASIKPEQFYNAVDYGDPAPSSLEPVSAAIDQTAHPVIPGRNLVRVAIRTASTGRSAAQPLRLTLLVDQSGSMVRADRRVAMATALEQLGTLLTENDEVTVIGFSRTPRLLADSMKGNEAGKLRVINQTANEGGTNLEQAINLASELALRHKLDGAQNRIVLFTDGAANLGNANPERLSDKIGTLRQQGLAFDIAGIGTNDLNDNLLAELARHGNGRYYLVGENTGASLAAQLAGAFRPAAENVKVQVKLNPQRVGNYKLIGFEKDRLKTEDFRNDSVDAAEFAADEAGVAIYQVETLPEGTGEIGEVSVRFRDTASGEMFERTWTIPYDSTTPAFDKADPKTQLATLSLLAAQKLQPGPLADAISFRNFSETIARLKQTYANDAKAQQMLNFVNSLK